ncbi:DNA polymerase II large subunit [Candidatus Woesearchaeota archaeon]|nr:DNA polymerase II large subunit [Candidatus Woesearchaeota archaeon]
MAKDEPDRTEQRITAYFREMERQVKEAHGIATAAKRKGYDPLREVDVKLAKNMAERVVGFISIVAPQLQDSGLTGRIQELEKQYGILAWEVALIIAEEVAKQKFCSFKDEREAMEVGIRTGFAYHTLGIVAAPLEGFIELHIKERADGGRYVAPFYAGPIRGAGGTAASVSVIITDYVRTKMGYGAYDPTEDEIRRYITEINDYHSHITNLQYHPSDAEIDFLVRHLPVEINGDPTEQFEVSNYKGLPRVETDRLRGGVCLVIAEGISQKAPKIWKRLSKWGKDFGLNWGFIEEFLSLQKKIKAQQRIEGKKDAGSKISPNYTYIKDLVAGRPVLTHPMADGGFRLRYGRSRISGFSAAAINPATTYLLNRYIATGTQLKVERPGKACSVVPNDYIEGPLVELADGTVKRIESESEAKEAAPNLVSILYLGDILFNYGDFSENGHVLAPAGYVEEWWVLDLEKAVVDLFGNLDTDKLADLLDIQKETLDRILDDPRARNVPPGLLIRVCGKLGIPLHPRLLYYWKGFPLDSMRQLYAAIGTAAIKTGQDGPEKIVIPYTQETKGLLGLLGVPHLLVAGENIVIGHDDTVALLHTLGIVTADDIPLRLASLPESSGAGLLAHLSAVSGTAIKDRAGTFIGARMGRPEKAKMRKLVGGPHALFPVGTEGGRLRSFQSALAAGKVTSDFPIYRCASCAQDTIYAVCESCGKETSRLFIAPDGTVTATRDDDSIPYRRTAIDINRHFKETLAMLRMKTFPDLIKGVRGTSNKDHVPEHLAKGILRAKHDVYVNKDGTTRYDMSEVPITHFRPVEIGTPVERLRELGYTHDLHGRELSDPNQIVEIMPQDVILPGSDSMFDESAARVLFRVANFVDDLLVGLYGLKPFYRLTSADDLVGHLIVGLAPHISAGMVGRIIGFSKTQGFFAHPLYHAALRRDCDGDEACVIMLMDCLVNFSRLYLPNNRGGRTMDAPLVLTSKLVPTEVDDQVHGIDVVWRYPLEFYRACEEMKNPWDVEIEQLARRLHTPKEYYDYGFTHPTTGMNQGVRVSAYKTLPSMEEKLKGQMELAERIRAVDASDVARLVIEKHFLKDIKGNLRKFSMQQFRCVDCNEKYRRPPLVGRCTACGGKLLFTIAEGSVIKYLEPAISLAETYHVPPYLMQTLELLKRMIESNFGKDKDRQEGLGKWFGEQGAA